MLARTADHLYWMARSIERAEGLARMLDAHYRHSLLPHTPEVMCRDWQATLSSLGMLELYLERHGQVDPTRAFHFLAMDKDHDGSVLSCLRNARENARAVRGTITSEMWETLNSTWIESRHHELLDSDRDVGEFLEWVRYRVHLSRGVTLGTMLRDEAFHFARIGTFIEGGDATARMLLARAGAFASPADEVTGADIYTWTLLLRSLSAFEVYRRVYRDAVTPWRVTELLVVHQDLPRSLGRCIGEVYENLVAVRNDQSLETERMAGQIHSQFHFGRLENLLVPSLREFLEHYLNRIRDLGERIARDFLISSTPYTAS